jgi:hypothetical protein
VRVVKWIVESRSVTGSCGKSAVGISRIGLGFDVGCSGRPVITLGVRTRVPPDPCAWSKEILGL